MNNESILTMNLKKAKMYNEAREKKANIYIAIKEYIDVLERQLKIEESQKIKGLLRHEIGTLSKELKKYEVPSIMETAQFGKNEIDSKTQREKSSFQLIKKK